jgi:hypothetical protein
MKVALIVKFLLGMSLIVGGLRMAYAVSDKETFIIGYLIFLFCFSVYHYVIYKTLFRNRTRLVPLSLVIVWMLFLPIMFVTAIR